MKRFLFAMALTMLWCAPGIADQKADLVQAVRSDGFPLEAEVMARYVEVEMSPEWWAIMLDPGEERGARQSLRIVVSNMIALANNMGWGDLARLDQDSGRKGNSPPVLAMMDSWKDKLAVKLVLGFTPDDTSKKQTVDGLDRLGYPIGSVAQPRSGKFFLTATYDPAATDIKASMSSDASTYSLTLPAYTSWSQSKVDAVMKRGH
ncbi:MAG: hypothetical protein AB7S38_16215 [Vulcanimicrobiota bacterium]